MLFLYQPLIENARFYRLFCFVCLLFLIAVLAYLVFLSQIHALWLIVVGTGTATLIYSLYLCQLSDKRVLAQAEHWICLSNEKFQNSAYGIAGNAIVLSILILPFVLLTWLLYMCLQRCTV